MNSAMLSAGAFDSHVAPKRSNSGREIVYVQNQRVLGSQQAVNDSFGGPLNGSVPAQGIPADVLEAFEKLRGYSYRELYHWLKLDRQHEIKHTSFRQSTFPLDTRMTNPRLSIASQSSSAASSVFSANPHRMSVASSNTSYSQFSDASSVSGIHFSTPPPVPPIPHHSSDLLMMSRKKSILGGSPTKSASRNTLTQPAARPSPRQSQSELEAKKKYFCTSCNKGFARKYDWKVHEQRYHEQQKQYPCPDCNVVLHAETLFKSHHRDAHGCQDCPHAKSQEREVDSRRRRTAWGCGFCGELLDDWEKRCDHVSSHYDDGTKRDSWDHSKVIIGLLKQEDIDEQWRALLIQKHGQMPNPPINLRWSKEATGRSHGENSQQLQDLLEFGACPRDPAAIAEMAYELGIRTNVEGGGTPARAASEVESSPPEKSETLSEPHDSLMASPMIVSPDVPTQFVNAPMGNAQTNFDTNINAIHQSDSRMSSVGPPSVAMSWSGFETSMPLFQQPSFQQSMQHMSVSYNKELPPIPCEPADHQAALSSQMSEDPTQQFNLDSWTLLGGPSIADEIMRTADFASQHFG